MTGPVLSLPAALDTSDYDPWPGDHWQLRHGNLYRSRLIEDQSDSPQAGMFKYEGREGDLAYFTRRTGAALYTFALPPAQLEQAFHFHKDGEHDRPVPVNPLMALRGSVSVSDASAGVSPDGPQAQTGAPGQAPPNGAAPAPPAHEPVDTSQVVLSRTR